MNKIVVILIIIMLALCLIGSIAAGGIDALQEQSKQLLIWLENRSVDDINLADDPNDICLIKMGDAGQEEMCATVRNSIAGCRIEGNLLFVPTGSTCRFGIKKSSAVTRRVSLTFEEGLNAKIGLGLLLDGKLNERLDEDYSPDDDKDDDKDKDIEITIPRGGWLFIKSCSTPFGGECILAVNPSQ